MQSMINLMSSAKPNAGISSSLSNESITIENKSGPRTDP